MKGGGSGSGSALRAKKPRLTLAALALVVEAQRGEIAGLRERVAGDGAVLATLREKTEGDGAELAGLRGRVATLENAARARAGAGTEAGVWGGGGGAGGGGGGGGGGCCLTDLEKLLLVRVVRRKTAPVSNNTTPATTLDTLPRDTLHALAAHLGVEDQARLMQCCKVGPSRYCPGRHVLDLPWPPRRLLVETHYEHTDSLSAKQCEKLATRFSLVGGSVSAADCP